tara:strand:- start:298 stop:498 length:201 start_codon:yes stop_codon:yes gene_type:complete
MGVSPPSGGHFRSLSTNYRKDSIMGKRGIFNEEGELVEEYWEDETDDWYPSGCGDPSCDGHCQICW